MVLVRLHHLVGAMANVRGAGEISENGVLFRVMLVMKMQFYIVRDC